MPDVYCPRGRAYNLPGPNIPAKTDGITAQLDIAPTHVSSIYMELTRKTIRIRGYWILTGIITTPLSLFVIGWATLEALTSPSQTALETTAIALSTCLLCYWLIIPYIRMEIETPCNEPIRFNRARRKVYFYQYRFDRLNPLGKRNWGVKPVAHNWDDLTAEVYRIYRPMGGGGLIENILLSVRNPETDEVIDRVFFSCDLEQGKQYWELAKLFMQEGIEAIPAFVHSSVDWNTKDFSNPFERLAPKVQWPPEMDLESRTAPGQGEQP
ncbi:DUF6708 domain-containing protein [Pseudomonas sp. NPDC089758]|uniref:DUF6708 domain-containing protein n=1 Tax=Pseudomonas sp. NPDC089758 TaxID=3364473 RepID=UPI003806B32A